MASVTVTPNTTRQCKGSCNVKNRISEYFPDHPDNQDLYEEVCQAGWNGMKENRLDVYWGAFQTDDGSFEEDFFFKDRMN